MLGEKCTVPITITSVDVGDFVFPVFGVHRKTLEIMLNKIMRVVDNCLMHNNKGDSIGED